MYQIWKKWENTPESNIKWHNLVSRGPGLSPIRPYFNMAMLILSFISFKKFQGDWELGLLLSFAVISIPVMY